MMRRFLLSAGILIAAAFTGCSVNTLEDVEGAPTQNSCEAQSDCAAGSTCDGDVCRKSEGVIDGVVLAVTPTTTTQMVGGIRFLQFFSGMRQGGQFLPVELDPPSTVRGTVTVGGTPVACDVHVTFTPIDRVLGLAPDEYSANTSAGKMSLSIPAGDYEVYVRAQSGTDTQACPVVPKLYRLIPVPAGPSDLPLALGEPSKLSLHFIAKDVQLDGWRVSVMDSESGKLLSNELTLEPAMLADGAYYLQVPFNEVPDDTAKGQELIQLRPPADVVAPTLLWKREGLEVFAPGELSMDLSKVSFEMGSYAGFVEGPDRTQQAATLTFTSTTLDGLGEGVLGAYTLTTEADASGAFSIDSIPLGNYRVQVIPPDDSGLGAREVEISVTPKGQGGSTIQLETRTPIAGTVLFEQSGSPAVAGATVQAIASTREPSIDAFKLALGEAPFVPRASSGLTGQAGTFKLEADPGVFDISVRPAVGSNLPWLVRPNVSVPVPNNGLGVLTIPAPVVQSGVVSLGGQPVGGASVKAYAYLGGDGYLPNRDGALSVIAVGETYTATDGSFQLVLPSE
ncbi:MAG: hypothetical protein H6718_03355 [Polyangiaceae bacterium]|nr:hypothetical protein [Polyangiaceae bacterium]